MATVTRSFYAARGDYALHGLNLELSRVPLTLDAVVDFQASRRNDGVQLSLFYTPDRPLFLQVAAPEDGSWFLKNGFASNIDLIFSAPVDKASITSGTFTWRWSGGESAVGTGSITYLESDRQLRIPAPTLPLDYVGSLVLTFADVDSAETDPLSEVVSLHFDITEAGSIKAQPGASAFTRPTVTGYLGVGRLVVPFGQNVEQMVRTYLEQKSLDKEKILKVVQLEGSNKTLEIFLLWWQTTSPKVLSITPRSSGTIVSESPPSSILLQFDQPVPNPADYFEFDGVDGTDVAFTVDQLDNTGRQWRITKAGGLFATDGQHTLKIIGLPNVYGELAGPPMLFSWQVQPLMGGTSNSGASVSGSWKFDTSIVVADPGNKKFRVNNATLASVTQIYFNDTTVFGFDASTILGFLNIGDRIYVQQKNDASMAALFVVTAPATDNTGWWTVPVMVLESGTLYQNAAECAVVIAFSVVGITDHGALSGLGDDDHTQYHNNTRGDARYDLLGEAASKVSVHEGLADPHTQYNLVRETGAKLAVRVVDTANNGKSGAGGSVDGVTLSVGDRVLLIGQSLPAQNGIWIVASGSWTRATDMSASDEFVRGMSVLVYSGTARAGKIYYLMYSGTFTVDVTSQVWSETAAPASAAIAWKEPVRVVATSNTTLSGTTTIDGVSLSASDRVLLVGQTSQPMNGIWVVSGGAWSRATDLDTTGEFYAGVMIPVAEGTEGAGRVYRLATLAPITVDVTNLSFVQAVADSNRFFASGTEINSRVLISPLPSPDNFTVVSAVAYAVYLGRTTVARVWRYIEFELRTIASGSQTAELGLFSTPNPPSKAGQTLTELESTASVNTMIAGSARMIRNTVAFVGTLPAGTHLWAVFRCVMDTTQPVTGGHAGDMGQGWILTATPGSINGIGSYAGSVPSFTVSSVSPALRITAD